MVAAAIEQNHDERGILAERTGAVPDRPGTAEVRNRERQAGDRQVYAELTAAGFEVLLDDRDKKTSPGVKFADMELIGIPTARDQRPRPQRRRPGIQGRRDSESQNLPIGERCRSSPKKLSR